MAKNKITGFKQIREGSIRPINLESGFDGELIDLNAASVQGRTTSTVLNPTNSELPTSQAVLTEIQNLESGFESLLSQETQDRILADQALDARIDALESGTVEVDNITIEKTLGVLNVKDGGISIPKLATDVVDWIDGIESGLDAKISQEIIDREQADIALQNNIDALESGLTDYVDSTFVKLNSATPQTIENDLTFNGNVEAMGNVVIHGNILASGTTTFVNSENTSVSDNEIILNKGEVGAGVTKFNAGIRVDRGTLSDALLQFDENSDKWRVGFTDSPESGYESGFDFKYLAYEEDVSSLQSQIDALESGLDFETQERIAADSDLQNQITNYLKKQQFKIVSALNDLKINNYNPLVNTLEVSLNGVEQYQYESGDLDYDCKIEFVSPDYILHFDLELIPGEVVTCNFIGGGNLFLSNL
jgi:hypothetical protein